MDIQLFRHATLLINVNNKTLLIDPMLSDKEVMDPIVNSSNTRRNPLVALAAPAGYLDRLDAILLTHTHRDHFDDAAAKQLPKDKPVFCQPQDVQKLLEAGFLSVIPIDSSLDWEGIRISRTGGQHGTGEIGQMMAPVSGYVLETDSEPSLYIAGDTIYCQEVEAILATVDPDITVINGGGARFVVGDPITMTTADVEKVLLASPNTKVVVVHLDAINHCLDTRADFRQYFTASACRERLWIPSDGETIRFPAEQ